METLQAIGARFGTDKGREHSYLDCYAELLAPLRDRPITLLEIGVDEGRSMRMWLTYFERAEIYGIDIAPMPKLATNRLTLLPIDQTDANRLSRFDASSFDVIIDDGSHNPQHQLLTCHYLWHALAPGGLYFVEDVISPECLRAWEMMPGFRVWGQKKGGRLDDLMVILEKPDA